MRIRQPTHEAASLAGTLGLGKLVCLYDDNGISIDGPVDGWFRDDTPARFEAYGWHVVPRVDGHDPGAIARAIDEALRTADRPSLLCCRTVIGHGAPGKAGTAEAHGAPLGERELAATRARLGWTRPPFEVPEEIYAAFDARPRGAALSAAWGERLAGYARAHPALARELRRRLDGELPADFGARLARAVEEAAARGKAIATRKASQEALEVLGGALPELLGG